MTQATEETRSARRDATRERVLDGARDVFAERGVNAATVEEICERVGFTRGAFYSNFADKADVLEALVGREHARLVAHLDAMLEASEEGRLTLNVSSDSELAAVVDWILGSIPADRQLTLVMTELEIHAVREPATAAGYREADARFRARIARIVERGMALAGRELVVDPAHVVDAAVAVVAASIRRALLDGGGTDPDAMARALLPVLLLGASRPRED